jgi:hypothetical protein
MLGSSMPRHTLDSALLEQPTLDQPNGWLVVGRTQGDFCILITNDQIRLVGSYSWGQKEWDSLFWPFADFWVVEN